MDFRKVNNSNKNDVRKVDSKDLLEESTLLTCYLIFAFTRVTSVKIRFTLPRALYACAQCEYIL